MLSSSPTLFVKHSLKEPADQIRLGRLVKAGILKEGDELHYTRDFQGYDVQCLATVSISIDMVLFLIESSINECSIDYRLH